MATIWMVHATRRIRKKGKTLTVKHVEPRVIAPTKELAEEQIRHFLADSTDYKWTIQGTVKESG